MAEFAEASDSLERMGRSLSAALDAAGMERRRVVVRLAGVEFVGALVNAGDELVCLTGSEGPTWCVSDRLEAVGCGSIGSAGDVTRDAGDVRSVPALLRGLQADGARVELGVSTGDPVTGRVIAVSSGSHVELRDGSGWEWLVPVGAVCWVRRLG